jgi:hypothetical protein
MSFKLLTRQDAAKVLLMEPKTLGLPHIRAKLGLPCVRIGGRVRFLESDVEAVISRGRETLPQMPADEKGSDDAAD